MSDLREQTRLYEQIEAIQKEIRETPYHKGTEHHIGRLRARIARLKDKEIEEAGKGKGGGGLRLGEASGSARGYAIKHQGDATTVLMGSPSVGKSTLLNKLTNAQSKVAPYEFTTVSVIPGMMYYKNAKIQILDVPGLIEGAEEGKGRGREVLSVGRGANLLIIMTEVNKVRSFENIKNALERNGIRINQEKPKVQIEKKLSGGIIIHSNIREDLRRDTISEIAQEFGIKNAEITIKEKLSIDRLIDSLSLSRVYIPAIFVVNKVDLKSSEDSTKSDNGYNSIFISAEKGTGLDELKEDIWKKLQLLRVYLVRPQEEPSFENPIVMRKGESLQEAMEKLGSDFAENKKKAIIWGNGSKFPGQEVSLTTQVQEGMQVRFI